MTEINLKLLELLKNNNSLKEISKKMNLSEKQIYIRIKQLLNYGYNIGVSYSYNSDIYFNINFGNQVLEKNKVSIKMPDNNNEFRCLVISDLHIGAKDGDIKLAETVYEYASKNGINIILNCGDNIEGDYTSEEKCIKNLRTQIEYFVKKYPYDKDIINFAIFGNHDHHSLSSDGLDTLKLIKNARHDIVPIGYGQGNVNIKNDNIILFHKLRDGFKPIITGEKIVLAGHGHMMKIKLRDIFWVCVPTLSYQSNDKTKDVIPGFIDLRIDLENNKFEYAEAKHMIITPKVVQVSEVRGKVKTLFNDQRRK